VFKKAVLTFLVMTVLKNGNIDPVESLPYFHPNITKDEAVEKLRQGKHETVAD